MTDEKREPTRPGVIQALFSLDESNRETWLPAVEAAQTATPEELNLAQDLHYGAAELLESAARRMLDDDPVLRKQVDALFFAMSKLRALWHDQPGLPVWLRRRTLEDALKICNPVDAREIAKRLRDAGWSGFDDLPGDEESDVRS